MVTHVTVSVALWMSAGAKSAEHATDTPHALTHTPATNSEWMAAACCCPTGHSRSDYSCSDSLAGRRRLGTVQIALPVFTLSV